jgi:hypothetical protein
VVSRIGLLVVAGLVLAASVSCSDDEPSASPGSGTSSSPSSPESTIHSSPVENDERLPIGKSDLDVSVGPHLSPEGFAPELRLEVTRGWTSIHRDVDGFDLGMPDPAKDAPLVAVVFLAPPEGNAADALAEIEGRANGSVVATPGLLGSIEAEGLDITGGTGQLVASAQGGIALDATPDGRMQVYAADVNGTPVVVVIYVPDAGRWSVALPKARALLSGVAPA